MSTQHERDFLATHFKTPPDKLIDEQLRQYLLWHKQRHAPNTTTIALCGIKFFTRKS